MTVTTGLKRPFSQLMNLEDCCCGAKDMMQLSCLDYLDLSDLRSVAKTSKNMQSFVFDYLEKTSGHMHPQSQRLINLFRTSPIASRSISVYLEAAHELCEQYDALRASGCRIANIREDSVLERCEKIRYYLFSFQNLGLKGEYLKEAVGSDHDILVHAILESRGVSEASRGTAIEMAATKGNVYLVKMLHQAGPISEIILGSALKYAAKNGRLEVVKYFLDEGAEALYINESIRLANEKGHEEVIEILQNYQGQNALE